jgi:colanic acid biosynthesis glycosyl transferase WcaI
MRISVLGINFSPEPTGISVYNTEMCEYLSAAGHEVTMFTAFPYYPHWHITEQYRNRLRLNERHKEINVKRSYIYVPGRVTTAKRILHELSFTFSSFCRLLFAPRADLLVVVSPPLGLGLTAFLVSRLKKMPYIFHIQDLQPEAAIFLGMIKNKLSVNLLYGLEKFIYHRSALVSVIGQKMKQLIAGKGIPQEKILYFPNWADLDFIKPPEGPNAFLRENKLDGKFVVLYAGNLGFKQGLELILYAADRVRDQKEIIFLIVGAGNQEQALKARAQKMKLANVVFLPPQKREMLPSMLAAADVSLIIQIKEVVDFAIPSKTLNLMASKRPLIAACQYESDLRCILTAAGCGVLVEPGNADQLKNAVLALFRDPQKRKTLGENGLRYVAANFNKGTILEKLNGAIEKIGAVRP